MIDAPLLIEGGLYRICSKVIVIDLSPENQIKRLMSRDSISEEEALSKINSQMPLKKKLEYANFVIDNNGDKKQTEEKVNSLILKMKKTSPVITRNRIAIFFLILIFYFLFLR